MPLTAQNRPARQSRSSQQRRNRRPQRSKTNPIPIEPAMPSASRRHLEHQPLTLLSCETGQILTRNQKHVVRKPPRIPVPAEQHIKVEVAVRKLDRRTYTRSSRCRTSHPAVFTCKSEEPPARALADQHLNRLEVRTARSRTELTIRARARISARRSSSSRRRAARARWAASHSTARRNFVRRRLLTGGVGRAASPQRSSWVSIHTQEDR